MTPSGLLAWRFRDLAHLGTFHDDGIYLVSAQSLARNGEYRIASLPGEPYQTKYPPLYPLLLSLSWRLAPSFPANLPWAMLINWLTLPAYLVLAFLLFQDLGFDQLRCSVLCVVLGWNLYVVMAGISLLSDLLFCCFLLSSLIIAERAGRRPSASSLCVFSGLFGGAAYLTRASALPLLISSPLCFVLRKQPLRAALFLATMLPFVLGWQLWVGRHLTTQTDPLMLFYTDYFGYYRYNVGWHELSPMLWRNLTALGPILEGLLTSALTLANPSVDPLLLLLVLSLTGVVLWVVRGRTWHYALFGAGSLVFVLLWHYPPTQRFVLPLHALLLAGLSTVLARFVHGARSLLQRQVPRNCVGGIFALSVFGAGLCLLLLWHAKMFETIASTLEDRRAHYHSHESTFEWIARSVPANATFLAYHDPEFYLRTGRHAAAIHVPPRIFEDPSAIEALYASLPDFAARHRLHYLLVTSTDFDRESIAPRLRPVLDRLVGDPSIVRALHQSPEASVYEFQVERRAMP